MFIQTAFNFLGVVQRLVCRLSGLRLLALRRFPAFLASSHCTASVTSYHFASIASPPWRSAFSRFAPVVNSEVSVFASVANRAVKPTRLRRASYFLSLGYIQPAPSGTVPGWLQQSHEMVSSGCSSSPGKKSVSMCMLPILTEKQSFGSRRRFTCL